MTWDITLILGVAVFAAISTIISAGDIIDNSQNGIKALTLKGWVIIFLNFSIIVFSFFQYTYNEKNLIKKEQEFKKEQFKKDSITVSTITEILGKYGYKLDSTNQILEKVINEPKYRTFITESDPVLKLCNTIGIQLKEYKNGEYRFQLTVCSEDAGSTDFDCIFYFITEDKNKDLSLLSKKRLIEREEKLGKNSQLVIKFYLNDKIEFERIYISIIGTYKNISKSKTYEINSPYFYQRSDSSFRGVILETNSRIDDFIYGLQ